MVHRKPINLRRPWLFDQLRDRYEHPLEVKAYERQVAQGLLPEEEAIVKRSIATPSRILDLGCGAGREAFALESMGHEVIAADISQEMIKAAKKLAAKRGSSVTWTWMPGPLEIPLRSGSVDGVVAFAQLLSHIPDAPARIALLSEVRRVLRRDGVLVASYTTRKAVRELTGEAREAARGGSDRAGGVMRSDETAEAHTDEERDDSLSPLELAAGWEDGDILVWDPSEAELDEPLFFHCHTEDEIRNELRTAGLTPVAFVDPRRLTEQAAWDAHRYPFLIADAR